MQSLIVQQTNIQELELLIRKVFQEEIQKISSPNSPPPKPEESKLLSRREAAAYLRISMPTFSNLERNCKIKGCRIGKRLKYKVSHLENTLK